MTKDDLQKNMGPFMAKGASRELLLTQHATMAFVTGRQGDIKLTGAAAGLYLEMAYELMTIRRVSETKDPSDIKGQRIIDCPMVKFHSKRLQILVQQARKARMHFHNRRTITQIDF